jgi:hypothetical protein
MKAFVILALGTFGSLGCSTDSGENVDDGVEIAGTSFTAVGSASMVRSQRGLINIVVADFGNVCTVADESERPTSKQLTMLLAVRDAGDRSVPPTQPGTYEVSSLADPLPSSGPYATCGFRVTDAACQVTTNVPCDSGNIVLTRVDATGYAGTFDLVLAGDHVTGAFDTTNCDGVSESGFGTCQ